MKLYTLGYLTQRLQRHPASIEATIQGLGIEPELELNGLPYYKAEDETRIDQAIRHADAERILGRPIPSEVKS